MQRARKLERYLTQPFSVVADHTGIAGVSVELDDLLNDCEGFLDGRFDQLDEADCYMKGTLTNKTSTTSASQQGNAS